VLYHKINSGYGEEFRYDLKFEIFPVMMSVGFFACHSVVKVVRSYDFFCVVNILVTENDV